MDDTKVKISLIIPCYNVEEHFIKRALDSVAAQDFSDYEVIIVDDGSKPELHEVLERIVPEYEKTTLITIPNGGVSNARNVGVSKASGEYIAFLDGDDALTKHFFSESYKAAVETGADFVIGGVIITKGTESFDPMNPADGVNRTIYEGDSIEKLRPYVVSLNRTIRFKVSADDNESRLYISRGPVARLLKKQIADKVRFPVGIKHAEDSIWNSEVLSNTNKICVVSAHWYWYYYNAESVLHKFDPEMYLSYEESIKTYRSKLDMQDDNMFSLVCLRIIDGLKRIQKYSLSVMEKEDKAERKKIIKHLYTQDPWTMLKDKRFQKFAKKNEARYARFYKQRLLFFTYKMYNNAKKLKHKITGK